jgi:hypothetical protein
VTAFGTEALLARLLCCRTMRWEGSTPRREADGLGKLAGWDRQQRWSADSAVACRPPTGQSRPVKPASPRAWVPPKSACSVSLIAAPRNAAPYCSTLRGPSPPLRAACKYLLEGNDTRGRHQGVGQGRLACRRERTILVRPWNEEQPYQQRVHSSTKPVPARMSGKGHQLQSVCATPPTTRQKPSAKCHNIRTVVHMSNNTHLQGAKRAAFKAAPSTDWTWNQRPPAMQHHATGLALIHHLTACPSTQCHAAYPSPRASMSGPACPHCQRPGAIAHALSRRPCTRRGASKPLTLRMFS